MRVSERRGERGRTVEDDDVAAVCDDGLGLEHCACVFGGVPAYGDHDLLCEGRESGEREEEQLHRWERTRRKWKTRANAFEARFIYIDVF